MAAGVPLGAEASQDLPLAPEREIDFETCEGTWLSLDVSPDGRTIVFELLGRLYRMDVGGGRALALMGSMAFDSQPAISPDGRLMAFVSDRSGAENVWVAELDGSAPRQITANGCANSFASPAWSPDGQGLAVSLYRSDRNAVELWLYRADGGGGGERLTADGCNGLGAVFSPDGRSLYYAAHDGAVFEDDVALPRWRIDRLDLASARLETVVANPGGAFRPRLTPDGSGLLYGARFGGRTGLRIRELASGDDRWLFWPVEPDAQEALPTRDLLPGYAVSPDGRSVFAAFAGKIRKICIATGTDAILPFEARVRRGLGPMLRRDLRDEEGPVRARIIADPALSRDGRLAFSAFAKIHVEDPGGGARRVLMDQPSFMPSWSPDGRLVVCVSWTARGAGHVWVLDAEGDRAAKRVSDVAAFYTHPVVSPDGERVLALRSSHYERMHLPMEPVFTGRAFGTLRQAELVELPLGGGEARVIASGMMSGQPQFTLAPDVVFLLFDDGLNQVRLDGSGRRAVVQVVGPGYYFLEGPQPADDLRISPDGRWLLVQHVQQLHLAQAPAPGEDFRLIDLSAPANGCRRLTRIGADYFGWTDQGRGVFWAIGGEIWRQPLGAEDAAPASQPSFAQVRVEAPRDVAAGSLVLRGAAAITMRGDEVIPAADVLVENGCISKIGGVGEVVVPPRAEIRDVSGAFLTPGFIDAHAHYGGVRRGVLDLEDWGLAACLAYGVTAGLDPSTLTIDLFAYQDLQEAGRVLAPRLYSTGVAVFSFNCFASLDETRAALSRYVRHYRTHNLKEYRTGDRRVRQWVAMAARELGLMPTTEGALDLKLDLTQVIDGFAGAEHALGPTPLYDDVVRLMAQARISYVLTLQCSHGGPQGLNAFIATERPLADEKLRRFLPPFMLERLFARAPWFDPQEYASSRVVAGAAAIVRAGGLVGIGSHGNVPGLGCHWEMRAHVDGGFSPREALHAATLGSAETIGRKSQLGSLEPGKLADILVMRQNPLDDIRNTLSLAQVMQNGRLFDADTLAEVWPRQRPGPRFWFEDDLPPGYAPA